MRDSPLLPDAKSGDTRQSSRTPLSSHKSCFAFIHVLLKAYIIVWHTREPGYP